MNSVLIKFNSRHSRKLKVVKIIVTVYFPKPFRILESGRRAVLSSYRKAGKIVPRPFLILGKSSVMIVRLQSLHLGQLLFTSPTIILSFAVIFSYVFSVSANFFLCFLTFSVERKFQGRDVSLFQERILNFFSSFSTDLSRFVKSYD